ncbi:hypothetical protein [Paraburkholderia dinghuensis]|uniref:Uncharacterized protein n=1 Tax=Paraburkholderia dinghuensis TaxID=2305225 RepID=A0A3N6MQ40_9BURK|nr:hypothetical protein [Paraburkholderia dinghuensis]RQH05779.1 hypothetical protein D1Y85_14300 [Paraburkholderia dinghuensis]
MKMLEDGNFSGWMRVTPLFAGIAIWVGGLASEDLPRLVRIVASFAGFPLMDLGGLSSRARTLNIKSFDSSYKKARKSFEDHQEKPCRRARFSSKLTRHYLDDRQSTNRECSGLMNPDTDSGENARHEEVSDICGYL